MEAGFGADFLEHVSDPLLIARSNGAICLANPPLRALCGWTEPLVGRPAGSVIRGWDTGARSAAAARAVPALLERACGAPLAVELLVSSWRARGDRFTGAVVRRLAAVEASAPALERRPDQADFEIAQARAAHDLLEEVVEMLPQAVCVFDAQDRYLLWNRRYTELYPEIAAHLRVGIPFSDILRLSHDSGRMAEKADDFEAWLAERLAKHARPAWREEQELKDGRWLLHDDRRLAGGGAIGMRIDITDIKRREASFRLLFQSNPVPMLIFEAGTLRIADANDAACSLYGFARDAFLSLSMGDLHEDRERDAARRMYDALVDSYEGRAIWRHRTARRDLLDVLIFVRASRHQDRPCFLAAVVDVSDRIRAEAKIAHVAHHDPVTGLANRIRFRAVAETILSGRAPGGGRRLALHFLDLDGFKQVNDTYGHAAGDDLLRMVGERLQAAVRAGDLVARLGGDEFVVLQTSGSNNEKAMAARLLACLERSFPIRGDAVRIGASLGLAVAPRHGEDLDRLVAAADAALYEAKAAGRNLWRAARAPGRTRRIETPIEAA